jgi:hypothetical protein
MHSVLDARWSKNDLLDARNFTRYLHLGVLFEYMKREFRPLRFLVADFTEMFLDVYESDRETDFRVFFGHRSLRLIYLSILSKTVKAETILQFPRI